MGVDHGRADIGMPQEFLNRADVVSVFKEVSRKRVPKRMRGRRLGDARPADGLFDGPLDHGFVEVVPLPLARLTVQVATARGEHPWVEALTLPSTARNERNRVISGAPISIGWRLPWKKMYRLIQATYASSVLRL
jgi:hypothetical protein